MTNLLDKNALILTLLWMFRGEMIQTIRLEHGFDLEGGNLKMASKMAAS